MNQSLVKKQQLEHISLVILVVASVVFKFTINNIGVGYLLITLMFYEMFWVFFGYSFSNVIGRLISARLSKGKAKSARQIWKYGCIMQGMTGVLIGLFISLVLSVLLRKYLFFTHSYYLAWFFGLTYILRIISEILAGYLSSKNADSFIGFGSVIRQLAIFAFGFVLSSAINDYGFKVGELLKQRDFGAVYGCLGVCISIVIGEILVIAYYFIIRITLIRRNRSYEDEYYLRNDKTGNVFLMIWKKRLFEFFNIFLFFVPLVIAVFRCASVFSDGILFAENVGILLSGVVAPAILFATVGYGMILPLASKSALNAKHKDMRKARTIARTGFHLAFIYGSFGCSYLIAEGETIAPLISPENSQIISTLLIYGALCVIIGIVCAFCFKILVLEGWGFFVFLIQLLSTGVFTLVLNIFIKKNMDIMLAFMISILIYLIINTLGYMAILVIHGDLDLDPLNSMFIPIVVGAIIAIVNIFLSKLITPHLGGIFTIVFTLIEMLFVYLVSLLLLRNFRENELEYVPGKRLIYALGQMLHVL